VTGLDLLLWVSSIWSAWLLFIYVDAPIFLSWAANRLRRQHLPHWARHGHTPPDDEPDQEHGRHARMDGPR
jgi:hypothetical protein